ncbi:MAG: AmmeMemoRadiSam system protein B [Acidobacteria bacterium]|nr:AmmeMemoRadiSam system protein B [Acidobacteriota bacterium]
MGTASVRHPAVSGQFYPQNPDRLRAEIESFTAVGRPAIHALGCVAPHAGYIYSGHVAGALYARVELPETFIIMCPNHTGMGTPLAIMSEGQWETPLGNVGLNPDLAGELKSRCSLLSEDAGAHRYEHAVEVQLPFLQTRLTHFTFVPIAVGTSRLEALESLGNAIGKTVAPLGKRVLIIASSDMNHYESDSITRRKDQRAIERMMALDARGLYQVVTREGISMCGYGPAVAMLTAANVLGARSAELVKYATSGDVSGDRDTVVGYAGIAVS